jgi:hypothetical protein
LREFFCYIGFGLLTETTVFMLTFIKLLYPILNGMSMNF